MRRAAGAAAVLVAAALAGRAAAYVRTTDAETGVAVSWPVPVVSYDLSSEPFSPTATCAPNAAGDPVEAAVRASFAEWEQPCADLRLVYGGRIPELRTTGVVEHLVIVRNGWCSNDLAALADPSHCMTDPDIDCGTLYNCYEDHGDHSTVALTTVLYDPSTGRLYDADMVVNGWDGKGDGTLLEPQNAIAPHGYYFTCVDPADRPTWAACTTYGQTDCWAWDLQNTVTHEAGHFLGLAHPCGDPGTPLCNSDPPPWETVPYRDRAMYPYTSIGDVSKRHLSADDVAGICAIYPSPGGCGCGSGGAPGALAALLAMLALRPRPRVRR